MNLCPPGCLCVVHPLCIVWWKPGCPCKSVCLHPSHLISVATPCLECVHASVHEFMSTLHSMSGAPYMDSYMESWVPLCVTACVSQSPYFCFDGNLGAPVWECVCVPATPCLECVHASVHEFMSTLQPMSGPPPMDSYIESWVPLCVTACVSQSPYFCCYTLFRKCTCISTWIYVHLAAYVWSTPMHSSMEPWHPCMVVCLCPSPVCHLISVATPCLECVHASVHEFMPTLHPMCGPPPMDSYMESWVPLCVTACVSKSPYFCFYTLFRMCTCISTWIYVHLAAYVWSTPYA